MLSGRLMVVLSWRRTLLKWLNAPPCLRGSRVDDRRISETRADRTKAMHLGFILSQSDCLEIVDPATSPRTVADASRLAVV